MKSIIYSTLALFSLLSVGCSVNSTTPAALSDAFGKATSNWPAISNQNPIGQAFGKPWNALRAGARKNSDGTTTIQMVADQSDECLSSLSSKRPVVTTVLPNLTLNQERVTDADTGRYESPFVLIDTSVSPMQNLVADRSRIAVTAVDATGFDIGLYAHAIENSGRTSEINGKIHVVNCESRMAFADWLRFSGTYNLISFDGLQAPSSETSFIEESNSLSDGAGKPLRAILFPLYTSVSSGSSGSLRLGPIENQGASSKKLDGDFTLSTYDFSGPIRKGTYSTTVQLHLEVREIVGARPRVLRINYTAKLGDGSSTAAHQLVLSQY